MLLFWKLVDKTQISKPQDHTDTFKHNPISKFLSVRPKLLLTFQYEIPCRSFWSSTSGTAKLLNYAISKNDLQKSKVYSLDPIQSQVEPKDLSKVLMSLDNSLSTRQTQTPSFFVPKSFDWCFSGFFIIPISFYSMLFLVAIFDNRAYQSKCLTDIQYVTKFSFIYWNLPT